MQRLVLVLWTLSSIYTVAQTTSRPSPVPASDPQALSLAQQALTALTEGTPVNDVTLNATVVYTSGSDQETGTATLIAKGTSTSRIDLTLSDGTRSDVRGVANGTPNGAWQTNGGPVRAYAGHNSWVDAVWFFPSLSSLRQAGSSGYVFKYVGLQQHNGTSARHVRVFQAPAGLLVPRQLSVMDFYLDPTSLLPVSVSFNLHLDDNMNVKIPVEVDYSNYQAVNGIQVPFNIQRKVNGAVDLDLTVTNVTFNTGLLDSQFILQ